MTTHTIPEQELNNSQKMTTWKLGLSLLKTTLTFCQVIILLYTMSQAHKVVHASLNSISGQHSASFGHFQNGVHHDCHDHRDGHDHDDHVDHEEVGGCTQGSWSLSDLI